MKVFITGATGFIGSHLADFFLDQQNVEVRCLVRSKPKWLDGKPITVISGDLNDVMALKEGMTGADIVFHLAALVKAPKEETLIRTNVEATENLIRVAQKCNVPKIVVLSSLAAVGPSFDNPVDEEDELLPVSMYGKSKKLMEEMIHQVARPEDSITILRPPAVYGPREEQILSFFKICSKGLCPIVGDGDTSRISMVHVKDVIQGLSLASKQREKGIHTYFVSSDTDYAWNEIKRATSLALDKKLTTLRINPKIVQTLGTMLEALGSLFGQYPVMNKDKAREMTMQWTCSTGKIQKELGYKQSMSLEEGIKDTIKWYKKHNWL